MGFGRIFFVIFAFALLEVVVLAKAAALIGWPVTILLTVATALLGSYLFRRQGLATWLRLNQRMQQGEMPGQEMLEGVMLLLGGALLITPGFISDALGFALLLPGSRHMMAGKLIEKGTLQGMTVMQQGGFTFTQSHYSQAQDRQQRPDPSRPPSDDGNVTIDGDFRRTDDD